MLDVFFCSPVCVCVAWHYLVDNAADPDRKAPCRHDPDDLSSPLTENQFSGCKKIRRHKFCTLLFWKIRFPVVLVMILLPHCFPVGQQAQWTERRNQCKLTCVVLLLTVMNRALVARRKSFFTRADGGAEAGGGLASSCNLLAGKVTRGDPQPPPGGGRNAAGLSE